ncbi:phospholipase A2 inhibitor and Ly6/PLAUR domain-containing protein-like [Fundulus heteroclitus]|uniref:phospholipase A2 inhibitor and Ly6/PLAUR domain-containing protein-like n=1 Tax=Fundulus heteroclitus TaxID=8078 RepID=UPI00165B2D9E|nr:phospholipase A2 inhibitor and Ly6/PLAUR domain-containing protein-like [Fundulus heteroclitus]
MMKRILLLNLISALYSTAGALLCETCQDESCSTTFTNTCNLETMCITASIQGYSSGSTTQRIYKACASSSLCQQTGAQTFSVNLGIEKAIASAVCCNTDNCNSQTLPYPSSQAPNSFQCNVCDQSSQCNILPCEGDETNCFSATVMNGQTPITRVWLYNSNNMFKLLRACIAYPSWSKLDANLFIPKEVNAGPAEERKPPNLGLMMLLFGAGPSFWPVAMLNTVEDL